MQTADYVLLAVEGGLIGLGSYYITGVLKFGIARMMPRIPKDATKAERAAILADFSVLRRWLVRCVALLLGVGMGWIVPWPDWFQAGWGPIIGLVAGGFGPAIHTAAKKWLRDTKPGAVMRTLSGPSVTQTFDTLDDDLPADGEDHYIGADR
jgi:hypothetical protein